VPQVETTEMYYNIRWGPHRTAEVRSALSVVASRLQVTFFEPATIKRHAGLAQDLLLRLPDPEKGAFVQRRSTATSSGAWEPILRFSRLSISCFSQGFPCRIRRN
jgi:hypothetical protein